MSERTHSRGHNVAVVELREGDRVEYQGAMFDVAAAGRINDRGESVIDLRGWTGPGQGRHDGAALTIRSAPGAVMRAYVALGVDRRYA